MSSRPNLKTEVRRSRYKAAEDAEEGDRRRKDSIVEICKNRRGEIFQKKRREGIQAQAASAAENKDKKEPSAPPLGDIGSDEMQRHLRCIIALRLLNFSVMGVCFFAVPLGTLKGPVGFPFQGRRATCASSDRIAYPSTPDIS